MRRHFLIDASALVPYFLKVSGPDDGKAKAAILKLLRLRDDNLARLYIPNFCMAECSKAFAKAAFSTWSDFDEASSRYDKNVENLLDHVSSRRRGLIQSMPMKRRHLENIEEVFKVENSLPPRRDSARLSGLDALVISMGKDLARTCGRDKALIVTKDKLMADVCNHRRSEFPKAIYILNDPIPDR